MQGVFHFRSHGGPRDGAGRKRKGRRCMPHSTRAPIKPRFPSHVTVRIRDGMPSLREARAHRAVERAFRGACEREGFRIAHYSAQRNHLHLIVERDDRRSLANGMRSLLTRMVRALNREWRRKGALVADRFHERQLTTPREVRHALAYVLNNARKHRTFAHPDRPDPYSSGSWFDGWRDYDAPPAESPPVAGPRRWLLTTGWRKFWGTIPLTEVPRRR